MSKHLFATALAIGLEFGQTWALLLDDSERNAFLESTTVKDSNMLLQAAFNRAGISQQQSAGTVQPNFQTNASGAPLIVTGVGPFGKSQIAASHMGIIASGQHEDGSICVISAELFANQVWQINISGQASDQAHLRNTVALFLRLLDRLEAKSYRYGITFTPQTALAGILKAYRREHRSAA